MITSHYHIQIGWRQLDFYRNHRRSVPAEPSGQPPFESRHQCFLPAEQIHDVIAIRNWLHKAALTGRYYLLGCYTAVTSVFEGVIVVFDHASDLVLFRTHWHAT